MVFPNTLKSAKLKAKMVNMNLKIHFKRSILGYSKRCINHMCCSYSPIQLQSTNYIVQYLKMQRFTHCQHLLFIIGFVLTVCRTQSHYQTIIFYLEINNDACYKFCMNTFALGKFQTFSITFKISGIR